MPSMPKAPDPKETAAAQGAMNRETAITQQNLNMIDQVTPTGSLNFDRTGWSFNPSENGSDVWYNATTGEYSNVAPPVVGKNVVQTPGTPGKITGGPNGRTTEGTDPSTTEEPIYAEGWQQVKGFLDPKYTATTKLSPEQQKIFDETQAAQFNLASTANERSSFLKDYLAKPIDLSGVPALQSSIGGGYSGNIGGNFRTSYGDGYTTDLGKGYKTDLNGYQTDLGKDFRTSYAGADDFSADRQRYEDAVRQRMAPDLASSRKALETQLIGRGLRPGTEGWNSEMDRLGRAENDASIAAILAGGDEQSRMVGLARDAAIFGNEAITNRANFGNNARLTQAAFGNDARLKQAMFGNDAIASRFGAENAASLSAADFRNNSALTGANFNNATRAQGLQEAYAQRNQPLQEIIGLLSGSQVQSPQFQSTPQTNVAGVDYAGLVSDKYKADVAASQAAMGGMFGLLSAPFGMFNLTSDRRAKKHIREIAELENGLPWYEFRYVWDRDNHPLRQGVMADEVRSIMPSAVIDGKNGGYDAVDYLTLLEAA